MFQRLGARLLQLDRQLAGVADVERPPPVAAPPGGHQVDGLGHALVGRDAGAAQVLEPRSTS